MDLDNAEAIRRFVLRMQAEAHNTDLNTTTTSPTTPNKNDQPANQDSPTLDSAGSKHVDEYHGATTPPHATLAALDDIHLTSPEAQPKPSPHISGLKAPDNSPKTAASSPRLAATNTHNEDVAEALSYYVNSAISRPLSESIWAPASARYKPSTLSGTRPRNILTPVKAVEHNPAINDTFDRMSFKAADPDHKMDQCLIGEHVTRSMSLKPQPSLVDQLAALANKTQGAKMDDAIQAKVEKASDEDVKPLAHTVSSKALPSLVDQLSVLANKTQGTKVVDVFQAKGEKASDEDVESSAHTAIVENAERVHASDLTDTAPNKGVGKENDPPSTSKAKLPPHLRATRISSQKPTNSETEVPSSKGIGPDLAGEIVKPGSMKDTRATRNGDGAQVTTARAGMKLLMGPSPKEEDLENKTFFNAWPASEERSRPQAKVRKVIIKDLPRDSTATFVASIVYGGAVEEIQIRSSAAGNLTAVVRFMKAENCSKFYEETSNGLVYKKDAKGRELVVFVELAKDVDVVGGLLQGWIDTGITRCVRAVGVESKWDLDGLFKIAERKNRKVEKIVDGQNAGGARSVVFRFCKVEDAVHFKAALSRDEDWEECNIHYAADPCATASGVHLES